LRGFFIIYYRAEVERRMRLDFIDRLADCADVNEARDFFRQEIAAEGFNASACGAFTPTDTGPTPHFFFIDWPEAWLELYASRNFVADDFIVAEARRRIAPFTWLEAKSTRQLSAAEQAVWDVVVAWGWTDGFTVPIHGPGGYFGLVVMAGKARDLPIETRQRLHLLALHTHDRCRVLTGFALAADVGSRLTSRELECLRWVLAGKSNWEIGHILSISGATAKFHIDHARRKLGVRTRAQAAAALLLRGLM
jgi:DNA-binding CsgD family transcriptional regulator